MNINLQADAEYLNKRVNIYQYIDDYSCFFSMIAEKKLPMQANKSFSIS